MDKHMIIFEQISEILQEILSSYIFLSTDLHNPKFVSK
jgi:hypothetical protein